MMEERKREIERAKITSAVNAMREMLAAASKAAHALKASEEHAEDEDYCEFDRVAELGYVVDKAGAWQAFRGCRNQASRRSPRPVTCRNCAFPR